MTTLELRQIRKSFGAVEVLHGIDATVGSGEFVAVLGESGCGKSTLLRIIAGLENTTSGEIYIDDKIVSSKSAKDRDIAMVFQSYALYPHMTVRDNIAFPLELARISKDETARRVEETAAMLNLGQYLDRKPKELSGGQRQRVAMGRAIVRQPKVFLFDEPLSNLDAKLRVQMRSEIRSLQRRLNVTSIYVTHDQIEALTMADKVMLLNKGKIEQYGPPLELYEHPANAFVASFVGSPAMNLVDGSCRVEGGSTLIAALNSEFEVGRAIPANEVRFGIRPEHIHLAGPEESHVSGIVSVVECTGDRSMLSVEIGNDLIDVIVSGVARISPDETVHLKIAVDDIHIFDSITGNRI